MKKCLVISFLFFYVNLFLVVAQENDIADVMNNNLFNKSKSNESRVLNFDSQIFKGWTMGISYGLTRFKGDVAQYDHYPAYQEVGNFYELKTAASLSLIKRINPLYSFSVEAVQGKFAGLRRVDQYVGLNVFDPYNNYEGRGDKFVANFSEIDLQLLINLDNTMSYFSHYTKFNEFDETL